MARNKYPEETVEKILQVSFGLFVEKGYDKTSIQDIVDNLGMSKGAIYHHFKSKEEILQRLCDRIYENNEWYNAIVGDRSLNALQKLERIFEVQLGSEEKVVMDIVTMPVMYNSRMILESIKSAVNETAPLIAGLMEEGLRDGSIHCDQPRETSELMMLMINLWINPGIFPVDREQLLTKVEFFLRVLREAGVPLDPEKLTALSLGYYDRVTSSPGWERIINGESMS